MKQWSILDLHFVYHGAEEWDAYVDEIVSIKLETVRNTNKKGINVKYKDIFFVFSGQESGEKLVRWWMNFNNKILKKQGLEWEDKIGILKRVVRKEAETIVLQVLEDTASTDIKSHK